MNPSQGIYGATAAAVVDRF